jgi:carbon monoxide dehydrogenase subunit G
MELTGERRLPATRPQLWRALNDPETLRRCIPGCRSLEPSGTKGYKATVGVTIGGIAADFTGELALLALDPPASCRIAGASAGGAAGSMKGDATLTLAEAGEATLLRSAVEAQFAGALAELDAPLLEASARQAAERFFDNLTALAAAPAPIAADGPAAAAAAIGGPARLAFPVPPRVLGFPLLAWASAAVFLFIVFNLFS